MIIRKSLLPCALAALVLLPAAPTLRGESVRSIIERTNEARASALTDYLGQNPDAPDKRKALGLLVSTNKDLGRHLENLPILDKLMRLAKESGDLNEIMMIGMASYEANLAVGNKAGATNLVAELKEIARPMPEAAQLNDIFRQMDLRLGQPAVGETMQLAFTGLKGESVDLATLRGKVVLVHFWSSQFDLCVREIPALKRTYDEFHEKGFEIIGISTDESRSDLEEFLADRRIAWPQHFQPAGQPNEFAKKFHIGGIPATFLIGPDGRIVSVNVRGAELAEAVDRLLRGGVGR